MTKYLHTVLICAVVGVAAFAVSYAQSSVDIFLPVVSSGSSADGQGQEDPTRTPDGLTIQGTVVSTGASITSATMELWRYSPGVSGSTRFIGEQEFQSAGTNSFNYSFTNVPRLTAGQVYYVGYENYNDTPGFLRYWLSENYGNPDGAVINVRGMDIADITLREPQDGANEALPEDFRWNRRATTTDRYIVHLYELNNGGEIIRNAYTPEILHPTDNIEITTINTEAGFQVNTPYRWRVLVDDGFGGFGTPIDSHAITFRSTSSVSASNHVGRDHIGSELVGPEHREKLEAHQASRNR